MSTSKPPNNPAGDGAPIIINGGIGGVSITGGAGGTPGDGGAVHITVGSGGNTDGAPTPDKPSILKIAQGAKVTNSTISDNILLGDVHLIDNLGSIENSTIERNRLSVLPEDPWYKKQIGMIGIGLFGSIIAALFLARLNQWL